MSRRLKRGIKTGYVPEYSEERIGYLDLLPNSLSSASTISRMIAMKRSTPAWSFSRRHAFRPDNAML